MATRPHILRLSIWGLLLVTLLFAIPRISTFTNRAYEDVTLLFFASAERAYAFGTEHFDSTTSFAYDIDRAGELYRRAIALDPALPFVHHQLARVEFLHGRLPLALKYVDEEIALTGPASPSTHYVKGLILGYMDRFEESALSFETYLREDPTNWAAINDYAWVLMKAGRPEEALQSIEWGLEHWAENPWLLNSYAAALFELGQRDEARGAIEAAHNAVAHVTKEDWSRAYPGNDPQIAEDGLEALRGSIEENMHTIMDEGVARENTVS